MKSDVYTTKGTKASAIELDEIVFGAPYNKDLVYQVVVAMQSNARQGSAHTKNRGEVRGGGIKPWRQKGTGRARHGSRRSPLWVGGGVTFGPRNDKDYSKKTNRKTKVKALYTGLSEKFRTTRIVLVDSAKLATISTKSVQDMINGLSKVTGFETLDTKKNPNNILIVTPSYDETLLKSIGNMPHVTMTDALSLNVLDVMTHRYMVISEPETVNAILASRHWDKETITPAGESTDGDTTAPKKKAVKKAVAKKAVTA